MLLYAICLEPFLLLLNNTLQGINIGHRTVKTKVVAYADAARHLHPAGSNPAIRRSVRGPNKFRKVYSNSIRYSIWDTNCIMLNIPYRSVTTILGTEVRRTTGERSMAIWSKTTALLKKQAVEDYLRDLTFPQRITYVHAYLFAIVWYTAQIFEPPEDCLHQILTTIAIFIWRGDIFRVSLSTLYRPKDEGG
jgi:hypothetical protein